MKKDLWNYTNHQENDWMLNLFLPLYKGTQNLYPMNVASIILNPQHTDIGKLKLYVLLRLVL